MKKIEIDKQTKDSLIFIFEEANKHANQVFNSIRESVNKTYLLLAICVSSLTFSFFNLFEEEYSYSIIFVGSVLGICFSYKNLFPSKRMYLGSLPETMLKPYFNRFRGEDLEKEILAAQIESYNESIKTNLGVLTKVVDRYKRSFIVLLLSFIFFGVTFFTIHMTKCCVL